MALGKQAGSLGNGLWVANHRHPCRGYCRQPRDILQAYWGKVEAFQCSRDTTKKMKILAAWEASLKWGGNCGVLLREQAMANLPSSAASKVQYLFAPGLSLSKIPDE